MKHGTEYELLTQQVYQILLNRDWPGKSICVQHDIKLTGKSGQMHQIDVYWEYELAGVITKVAIECKDYSRPLSIGKVRDFYGVLSDLIDVKGIIVASKGFQKGAKEYAKSFRINLKELSISSGVPVIAGIDNYITISQRRRLFLIDEVWAKDRGISIDSYRHFLFGFSMNREWANTLYLPLQTKDSIIYKLDGTKLSSIDELESRIEDNNSDGGKHTFRFDDAYVMVESGLIKIKGVLIIDSAEKRHSYLKIIAEGFVNAILEDAIEGNIQCILCSK